MATATGLRISSVDGTALLDNCPADILAAVDKQVKIYDASSRYLLGWVKAAGSSEGLGSDAMASFDFTSGWSTSNATVNDSNTYTTTANNGSIYKAVLTYLMLYKITFDSTQTAGNSYFSIPSAPGVLDGQSDVYKTWTHSLGRVMFYNTVSGAVTDVNTITVYPVTAPSSSGVTIVNTQGGSTYNWLSKDANFTYNAASYTYEIIEGHPATKRFGAVPFVAHQRKGVW